jgi:HK97 family phage portal protein
MRTTKPSGFRAIAWRVRSAFNALAGGGQALPPYDDYWYQRPGFDSAAGMAVSPETAMRLSAVYSCVRVISETIASLPLIIYKRLPNGAKVRATEHPLYKVLHDAPNIWQTSMEFIEMMQAHLELRGNAFAHILDGPRGPIDQLIPLHPDLVQVYRLPSGRLKYQVRRRFEAEVDWYTQDEIFHLRGLSSDGLVGNSPVAVQRETIGNALGMQDYAGRFFANDAKPPFVVEFPGKFKDDAARDKYRESLQRSQTQDNRHKVMLLEQGMKAVELGLTNKDSQFLEATNASAVAICGMFRIQPHKIGILDRTTHSNIEQQSIEFVTDTLRARVVRWERRINLDLIDPLSEALGQGDDEYFAEFLVDGLLRGDLKSRYDAYAIGRQNGWVCPNDVCRMENMNPIPADKGGDDYLRPVNMVVCGAEPPPVVAPGMPPAAPTAEPKKDTPDTTGPDSPPENIPDDEGQDAHAHRRLLGMLASEAAGRVVRKEVAALRKALARSPETFEEEAKDFYAPHATLVAQTLCIADWSAELYAAHNFRMLREATDPEDKSCVLDWIEDTAAAELASLALGQTRRLDRRNGGR